MKQRINALLSMSLLGGLVSFQAVAQAPAGGTATHPPATKVGIIQAQNALIGTRDGQRAVMELNKKLEPTKGALDKKANDIRELQDKLQRGGNAMAEAAKADLTRQIDTKTKAYNRDMEDAQAEADAEQRKMIDELSNKMTKVIDNYAMANGYALILDVSNPQTPVLYASTAIEITKDIVDLYDKTYPVTLPAGAAPTSTPAKPPVTPAPKPGTTPTSNPPATKKQP